MKQVMKTAVGLAVAVGLIALLLHLTGREVDDGMRRHLGPLYDAVGPVVEGRPPKAKEPIRIFRGDRVEVVTPWHWGKRLTREEPTQVSGGRIDVLPGPARVIDGDTLDVSGVRVRLYGIDSPENAQSCRSGGRRWPCGREATKALAGQIGSKRVVCEERDRVSYGRIVAVCSIAGRDLNAWMVTEGWALAYRRYSLAYMAEESRARAAKRGVWRGQFVAPWEWREGRRVVGIRRAAQ